MTLQAQLRLGAFLLFVLAVGMAAYIFSGYVDTYRHSVLKLQVLTRYGLVLEACNALSAERGPSNLLLSREPMAPDARALDSLRAARRRTDLALGQLDAMLRAAPADTKVLLGDERQAGAALEQSRASIDAISRKPLAARSPDELQAAIDRMIEARAELDPIVDSFSNWTPDDVPLRAYSMLMARILSELREYGGRIGSMLLVPLSKSEPISPARRLAIENLRGRIDQLHRLMDRHGAAGNAVTLAQARVEQGYFGHTLPLIDRLVAHVGADYGLTVAAFSDQILPDLRDIERLDELFIGQAIDQVAASRAHAREQMILLGVYLLGFLCFLSALLRTAERLIVRPLLQARGEIIDLACGKLDAASRHAGHSQEVSALYEALDVLREHQRQSRRVATERDELSRELHRMAYTDALTGLLNRRALNEMAGDPSGAPMPLTDDRGLILIDVDHFKSINDTYGHVVGDLVLREVGKRIRAVVEAAHQVFRYGGEEFAVLTDSLSLEQACALAEHIRHALTGDTVGVTPTVELTVTASFGIAVRDASIPTWFDLLQAADVALYRAKAQGRNQLIVAVPARAAHGAESTARPAGQGLAH